MSGTDPEFLAMRSINRALETLPTQSSKQRVVRWCVSRTFDESVKQASVVDGGVNPDAIDNKPEVSIRPPDQVAAQTASPMQ